MWLADGLNIQQIIVAIQNGLLRRTVPWIPYDVMNLSALDNGYITPSKWQQNYVNFYYVNNLNWPIPPLRCGTPGPCPPLGDVNGDGCVTIGDATLVTRYLIGLAPLTLTQKINADVNRDGKISIIDAQLINNTAQGLTPSYNCGPIFQPSKVNMLAGCNNSYPAFDNITLAGIIVRHWPDGWVKGPSGAAYVIRELAYAIVRRESGGNPYACSHTADYGLFQLNAVHFQGGLDPNRVFDPEYNSQWAQENLSNGGQVWHDWYTFSSENLDQLAASLHNVRGIDEMVNARQALALVGPVSIPPPETIPITPAGPVTIPPGATYTVQPGDTLSSIAARFLGSASRWPEICTLNALSNCNLIFPGQVLHLPGPPEPQPIQPPPGPILVSPLVCSSHYVVQAGDSLWTIAQKLTGNSNNWINICKINQLTDCNLIFIGETLCIP